MNIKDFIKAKKSINDQFKAGKITSKERDRQLNRLRTARNSAKRERLSKTPFGRFMNWLTTPAPLSEILEPIKGPAVKKKAAPAKKTAAQTAASENIGAVSGARPKAKPNQAAKKPAAKPKRKAPKFDPTGMKLPKSKPKAKPKTEKKFTQIDVQTGKPKFDAPKVSAAVRLKQEDRYKVNKKIRDAATKSMKKKKG